MRPTTACTAHGTTWLSCAHLFATTLAFVVVVVVALAQGAEASLPDGSCNRDSKCPSFAPCCSAQGFCGATAAYCLAGCQALASFAPTSCRPMPRCVSQTIDLTSKRNPTVARSRYTGDPSVAPLVIDSGTPRPSTPGLKIAVGPQGNAAFAGTTLSTARYLQYGRVTVRMMAEKHGGIVHAFTLMSDTADELDWEFVTSNPRNAETNMFYQAQRFSLDASRNGLTVPVSSLPANYDTAQWHDYTIDWNSERVLFQIDGKTMRNLARSSFRNKKGVYEYPSTPMRVQLGIWDGSQSHGNAPGVEAWSGGPSNYSKADSFGTYTTTIASVRIDCREPASLAAVSGNAYAFSTALDPTYNEPKVQVVKRSTRI